MNHQWTKHKAEQNTRLVAGIKEKFGTVEAFGKAVCMSEGAVAEYINQHRQASSERKVEWAQALGKDVLDLWRKA